MWRREKVIEIERETERQRKEKWQRQQQQGNGENDNWPQFLIFIFFLARKRFKSRSRSRDFFSRQIFWKMIASKERVELTFLKLEDVLKKDQIEEQICLLTIFD